MKILMIFAASAMSAGLVLPTVSQAETDSIRQQVTEVAGRQPSLLQRQA